MWRKSLNVAYKTARKIVVAVMGLTVVLFGIILIFTPGPAFVFIPLGFAILGLEFTWARRWLRLLRVHANAAVEKWRANSKGS
jgi:uncharacterized protein (TIGR02611 family)